MVISIPPNVFMAWSFSKHLNGFSITFWYCSEQNKIPPRTERGASPGCGVRDGLQLQKIAADVKQLRTAESGRSSNLEFGRGTNGFSS
jgi:hypothetical protein